MRLTQHIRATELSYFENKHITVHGHAQAIRCLGSIVFIVLRDASGLIQAVVQEPKLVTIAKEILVETPLILKGQIVNHNKNGFELVVESIEILAQPESNYIPVEIAKESKLASLSQPAMFDYRPLTLRAPSVRAIFEIEAEIRKAFREYLTSSKLSRKFVEINTPKIVATGTEGGAQLFQLNYFGKNAYLAQSPQFYKQMMVAVFERVYEIGPVYRAEEHDTSRHINEYISMDIEMGFISGKEEIMSLLENLIAYIIECLAENCTKQLKLLNAILPQIKSIPIVSLEEALAILQNELNWQGSSTSDLDPAGERLLCEYFAEKEGSEFVFVTGYLQDARPFYAMPEKGSNSTESFDLLFRGVEISTGGQRIHEYKQLVNSIEKRGLNVESFADYLQCFRYGMPPHGGFAIGLERFTQQLLNLASVKLASLFPRDCNRISP